MATDLSPAISSSKKWHHRHREELRVAATGRMHPTRSGPGRTCGPFPESSLAQRFARRFARPSCNQGRPPQFFTLTTSTQRNKTSAAARCRYPESPDIQCAKPWRRALRPRNSDRDLRFMSQRSLQDRLRTSMGMGVSQDPLARILSETIQR